MDPAAARADLLGSLLASTDPTRLTYPSGGDAMTAPTEDVTRADQLEARCRKAMAQVPQARGFDTQRVRDEALRMVDLLLDEWLFETA